MILNLLALLSISLFNPVAIAKSDITMPPKNPKAQATRPPAPNATGEYGEVRYQAKDSKPISSAFTEDEILVEANVKEVCPKKGCWMTVKGANSAENIRVTFKDYGFFVPTELVGKNVALRGRYSKHTESVEEQKHLLQDAKRPQSEIDAITKPKDTLRFIAVGVKDLTPQTK